MIALKNNLPLLQTGYCVISDYDQRWLEDVLQEAATAAQLTLPFKSEIACGILLYLQEHCPLRTVPLDFLFSRIRELLLELGLPHIANHLRKQVPPVDINLDALAQESPLPLFFYANLRRQMEEMQRLGLTAYRFLGKKTCSLVLGQRHRACPTQRKALEELEAFLNLQQHS